MATDFRLYHSNALDLLAELLADTLRQPATSTDSLLTPDTILIPQVAMRRWLQATLAQKFGVAANLHFLTPGEFVAQALAANVGPSHDDLDMDTLHWRVYAALGDAALLAQPALAAIARHLAAGDAVRRWALAGELANSFNKYAAWRRDWLLHWEEGAESNDAQAILWRAVAMGRQHRARRIGDYLGTFANTNALPCGLPTRLFAFATLNVSPDVLRVMATQAKVGTLHFYLPTPSREYWGDLRSLGARLHAGEDPFADADENPLLRDCGAAGKDFMALLGSYEAVHPSAEVTAYADPDPHDPAKPTTLLRQMQSDVYHRRAVVPERQRQRVDYADPSLQFHACHTRLREVQVLHDQLRALLDDTRFEPPLQPRDIAVLAPDIDAYAPYLDAVFNGDAQGGRSPSAMADTSPLQSEPLVAVFLRLLALPSARFGLEETLDLLASPPLAAAAGLQPTDFEHLHTWLHAAGARWGWDAAQRARSGAPEEASFTWQFALDRLLLGLASGSEALIAGVAPWPQWEGSAVTTLDRLLRQLQILAHYEQALRTPATPEQWRERLLGLLQALLPQAPAERRDLRALDRLRNAITDFAQHAARAEVELLVPIAVVQAYFTQVLSAADTRAPLLTGGVSVARMVPMRLLPFRVICLLGMNDGEFPRSDPSAGLNKLTAEMSAGKRNYGDRSTRDDDRFLFLQLFAAAQDVFYLSWQGKDPRDGSTREPSVLVDELLAVTGSYHAGAAEGNSIGFQHLVLAHALQPFSPEAFGNPDDPRVFSYRANWQPAAQRPEAPRQSLPIWLPEHAPLARVDASETALSLTRLQQFFKAPAKQFLRQRLALRQPEIDAAGEDVEPLQVPQHGLDKHALQQAVCAALLTGETAAVMLPRLRAQALLPAGPLGEQGLDAVVQRVRPYVDALRHWQAGQAARTETLTCDIDGLRLHGSLHGIYPHGIARLQFGERNGPSVLRSGLDWLLACAAGLALPLMEFYDDKADGLGPHRRAPVPQDVAIAALRTLLAVRQQGLQAPLLFAPYSSWALFEAEDVEKGLKRAVNKWRGSERSWAEGRDAAYQLALRGQDPFSSHARMADFACLSGSIFGLLTEAQIKEIEVGTLDVPEAESEDEEGAA